jgi:hypothetical protein
MADDFDAAASWLSSNPSAASLPNDTKLEVYLYCLFRCEKGSDMQIYGLFKYATTGSGPLVFLFPHYRQELISKDEF